MKQTLYDKIWNSHQILKNEDGTSLLYIDRHLIHEVTSPQALKGSPLKKGMSGIKTLSMQSQIIMCQL